MARPRPRHNRTTRGAGMAASVSDLRAAARSAYDRSAFSELETHCAAILEKSPHDVQARRLLGRAALREQRPDRAEPFLRTAAGHAGHDPALWTDLARALVDLGRAREAEAVLAAAHSRGVNSAGLLLRLGALRLNLNRAEDARDAFEAVLDGDPQNGEAYRGLAAVGALAEGGSLRPRAEALMGRNPRDKAGVAYALAEAALSDGDVAQFWSYVRTANDCDRARKTRKTIDADTRLRRSVKAIDKALEAVKHVPPAPFTPILIFAGPGAGGVLAEQAFRACLSTAVLGETGCLALAAKRLEAWTGKPLDKAFAVAEPDDYAAVALEYWACLQARAKNEPVIVDRPPDAIWLSSFAAALLPNARIVIVSRTPLDQGLSIYRRPMGSARRFCDLPAIGRHLVRSRQMEDALLAAFGGRVTRTSFEALSSDPDGEAQRLREACGLPSEAVPPSPPRPRAQIDPVELPPGDAQHHSAALAPLAKTLGPLADDSSALEGAERSAKLQNVTES